MRRFMEVLPKKSVSLSVRCNACIYIYLRREQAIPSMACQVVLGAKSSRAQPYSSASLRAAE
jgi:hypothetical protein